MIGFLILGMHHSIFFLGASLLIMQQLTLPSLMLQVSLAARQLINALLQRDPASRLGSNTGANEIKEHPFFHGIKWPLIRCMVIVLQFFNE